MKPSSFCKSLLHRFLSLALPFLLIPVTRIGTKEGKCAYVMLLTITYWILQPVPLSVTGFFPVVLFPFFGVLSTAEACEPYGSPIIMFVMAGIMLSLAMEQSGLHQRLAIKTLLTVGVSNTRLLIGFIICSGLLSMWVNNIACFAMMFPIAERVIAEKQTRKDNPEDGNHLEVITEDSSRKLLKISAKTMAENTEENQRTPNFSEYSMLQKSCLLGIVYATNIGGTGNLSGTSTNLILIGLLNQNYPESTDLNFGSWFLYSFPGMVAALIACGVVLHLFYLRKCPGSDRSTENVKIQLTRRYQELGPFSFHEAGVSFLIILEILLLFSRDPKVVQGWSSLLPGLKLTDATPAMGISLLLFFIPSKPLKPFTSPSLLDWKFVKNKMPWGLLLITSAGFSLARGFEASGLSFMLQSYLAKQHFSSPALVLVLLVVLTTILTELISNVTSACSLLPVVKDLASVMKVNPLYFMVPVTISCSHAFVLPIATPGSILVYEMTKMKLRDMVIPGLFINVICCFISLVQINTLGVWVLDVHSTPSWAGYQEGLENSSSTGNTSQAVSNSSKNFHI